MVTSLLTMFPTLFQDNSGYTTYTIDDLIEMGLVELDDEGNIIFVDGALTEGSAEDDHAGHDHDGHDHE